MGSYVNALNTRAVCVLLKWEGKSTDAYSFLTHVHSERSPVCSRRHQWRNDGLSLDETWEHTSV